MKVLDRAEAKERLNASDEVISSLVLKLLKSFQGELSILAPSRFEDNRDEVRKVLHKLKGAAGNVAAQELFAEVRRAEALVVAYEPSQGRGPGEEVQDALRCVLSAYDRLFQEVAGTAPEGPKEPNVGSPEIVRLRQALAERDFVALDLVEPAEAALCLCMSPDRRKMFNSAIEGLRFADALDVLDESI